MESFLVGMLGSAIVGVVLWALLPRGVVLTRERMIRDWQGEQLLDTWQLRNDSALPVLIRSVTITGARTYNDATETIEVLTLTTDTEKHGITLHSDDEMTENGRGGQWTGVEIMPGDTLTAVVPLMSELRIEYRRAGWLGVFERRELRIAGGI